MAHTMITEGRSTENHLGDTLVRSRISIFRSRQKKNRYTLSLVVYLTGRYNDPQADRKTAVPKEYLRDSISIFCSRQNKDRGTLSLVLFCIPDRNV
jgi:hypothetical protein